MVLRTPLDNALSYTFLSLAPVQKFEATHIETSHDTCKSKVSQISTQGT